MAYGFKVLDELSRRVVDDESFVYTVFGSGNTNNFSQPSGFNVRGPITKNDDELIFFDFPVGKTLYFGPVNVLGPQDGNFATPNTDFIRARPFFSRTLPNFGMAVFNASGQATFHTGDPLVATTNVHSQYIVAGGTPNPSSFSVDSSSTHISLSTSIARAVTVSVNPPFASILGAHITRDTATSVSFSIPSIGGTSFVGNPLFPVTISAISAVIL